MRGVWPWFWASWPRSGPDRGARVQREQPLSLCVSTSPGTGSTLMIVTEYMSHGALDSFLRVSAVGPGGEMTTLFSLCWDLERPRSLERYPLARPTWWVTGQTEAQRGPRDFPGVAQHQGS